MFADFHIAHSLGDALDLAADSGIGVCIDLFYCWAEAHLSHNFARAAEHCRLVQVGDYVLGDRALPARAVPGDGAIPLRLLVGELIAAGYAGLFDLELLGPRIDAEGHLNATRRAARWLSEVLEGLEV
jgi:sugar phosphate isomerase/epimerase